jgi:hypothetical protein
LFPGQPSGSVSKRSGFLAPTSFLKGFAEQTLKPWNLGGGERRNPPPGSLQAVGWKLGLAQCQFLPSPETPVVLIIVVADVVLERDDIGDLALIEMARDNITSVKSSMR